MFTNNEVKNMAARRRTAAKKTARRKR